MSTTFDQDWRLNPIARRFIIPLQWLWSKPTLMFVTNVFLLLLGYLLLDKLLHRVTHMPSGSYNEAVLSIAGIKQLGTPAVIVFIGGLIGLWRFGGVTTAWQELEYGNQWRGLIIFLCLIIAWPVVTFGYNYYLQQWHLVDRLLIVSLVGLTWWRPLFIVPLLISTYAMYGQLLEPTLGGTVLAHKIQVLRALEIFAAGFGLFAVTGFKKTSHILFVLCCFVAAAYWVPALAKHNIDWLAINNTANIPLAAYTHGWLGHLSPSAITKFSNFVAYADGALKVLVLFGEGACLFFLFSRRITLTLLVTVIVFHFGVFILFGFLFWTWIALDAGLLVFLMAIDYKPYARINWWVRAALSVGLILLASWWAKPPVLAWYDTPLSYVYRISMVDENLNETLLHPEFFAPYDEIFAMSSFAYLSQDHAVLVGSYGATHRREINELLQTADSADQIFEIEKGQDLRYNPQRSQRFHDFLYQFAKTRNAIGDRGYVIESLRPPPQFWVFSEGVKSLGPHKIDHLIVTEITAFYNNELWQVIRSSEVMRVQVANK